MKTFLLYGGTYDYNIRVCIEPDRTKVAKWMNKRWGLPTSDHSGYTINDFLGTRGLVLHYADYCPVIWMPQIPKTPDHIGTTVHEILHCVIKILRHVHIPLATESEEAYTHLMTHLTRQFFTKIKTK